MIHTKPISWNLDGGLVSPKWDFFWSPQPFIVLPFWAGGGDPRNYGRNVQPTPEGTPGWLAGPSGIGYDLNTTNDRLDFQSPPELDDVYPFTLVADFLYRGHGDNSTIHGKRTSGFNNGVWYLRSTSTGTLLFNTVNSGTNMDVVTNEAMTTGERQTIILTWPGTVTATDVHIYINGIEATYATQVDATAIVTDATENWVIGGRGDGSTSFNLNALLYAFSAHPGIWTSGQVRDYHEDSFGPYRPDLRVIAKAAAVGAANPHNPLGHPLYGPFSGPVAA